MGYISSHERWSNPLVIYYKLVNDCFVPFQDGSNDYDENLVSRYFKLQSLKTHDETQEETGWKLVHGDAIRPPNNAGLLCVCAGTGV